MKIVDLTNTSELIHQVCELLVDAFEHAWADMNEAFEEVEQTLQKERISRIAIDTSGTVLGWIAGASSYEGNVWELHPLVVRENHRKQGIGTALVMDFEQQVKLRGGITITLGADDESDSTTFSGVDLYADLPGHMANFKVSGAHPAEFYKKRGFVITGVVPDANGIGKPDILMSKRVALSTSTMV